MNQRTDNLFDALANDRRRELLFALLETNPLPEDAVYPDSPPDAGVNGERNHVVRQHVHLPKLDDYGFVEWTPGGNDVERGPRFEEIRPALEVLDANREALPRMS